MWASTHVRGFYIFVGFTCRKIFPHSGSTWPRGAPGWEGRRQQGTLHAAPAAETPAPLTVGWVRGDALLVLQEGETAERKVQSEVTTLSCTACSCNPGFTRPRRLRNSTCLRQGVAPPDSQVCKNNLAAPRQLRSCSFRNVSQRFQVSFISGHCWEPRVRVSARGAVAL